MRRMEFMKIGWPRSVLIVAVYLAGHYLLVMPANLYWHPPAGWRFLFLLFAPMRLWPFMLFGEWVIFLPDGMQLFAGHSGLMSLLTVGRMIGLAIGPWMLRHKPRPLLHDNAASMQYLLLAMFASAMGNAMFNAWRPFEGTELLTTLQVFLQIMLGDINGMLLIVPVALMLTSQRPDARMRASLMHDLPLVLIPALLLYSGVIASTPSDTYFFATALCAFPVLYFALRSGWRGVAIAFPLASIAVAVVSIASGNTKLATQVQLFLAIVGVASLLLGASVDALNARNRMLEASNTRLDRASDELREAARRNLGLSEDLRRWITSELHDELGQNLTALQTRMKLAERNANATDLFQPMRDIVTNMRHSVSGLMASLRPAGLDELGLVSTLQGGSIRELVETSGLAFHVAIEDPDGLLDQLDNNAQTAIYRIVQEAATNAVRHADAANIHALLRARQMGGRIRIGLSIGDDGRGFAPAPEHSYRTGIGLQGIRDRVLVLGGRLRLRSDAGGTRLIVAFRILVA